MTDNLILIVAAFLTSIISGTIGMAGGIILLSIMMLYLPPLVLIPVHGLVQLVSNTSRVLINYRQVAWPIVLAFAVGGAFGAAIGSQFVVRLPEKEFQILLAVFILMVTWMPTWQMKQQFKAKFYLLGGAATFLGLFFGATGPLLAPFFIREKLAKAEIVATKAACQFFVHFLKIIVFFFIGFSVGEFLPLIFSMSFAVIAGNWVGKVIMGKIPEQQFRIIFKTVITVLALRLLSRALGII